MHVSRRQFNRGAVMLSGAVAMPPVPVSLKRGSDDAYETIISEYIRVEESARAAGITQSGDGAVSVTGKHLEGFISHLDMQVSPLESSSQVYRELRGFVKEQVRDAREKLSEKVSELIEDSADTSLEAKETALDEQREEEPVTSAGHTG